MSFAPDWGPAVKMQVSTGLSSQLMNLVFEIGIFVASELFLRSFSVTNGNAQNPTSKNRLLVIQACSLLLFSGLLYLYQRVAYILISTSVLIFCRVLWSKRDDQRFANNKAVSKPIGIGRKAEFKNSGSMSSDYNTMYINPQVTNQEYLHADNSSLAPEVRGDEFSSFKRRLLVKQNVSHSRVLPSITSSARHPLHSSRSSTLESIAPRVGESKPEEGMKMDSYMETKYPVDSEMPSTSPPGLVNRGNTCFVNSVIQCLTWSPRFSKLVFQLSQGQIQNDNEAKFIGSLNSVLIQCRILPDGHSVLKSISTYELLKCISTVPQHLVSASGTHQCQQDAAEFLQWLLNNLHSVSQNRSNSKSPEDLEGHKKCLQRSVEQYEREVSEIGSNDLKRLEGPMSGLSQVAWELHLLEHSSLVHDIFMGQFLEVRQCKTCSRITTTSEYFTVLPLPIVGHLNELVFLHDCILHFSSPENLVQDNMVACECSPEGSSATRLTLLSVIPDCIIIQLTRFTYDSIQHAAVKNSTPVLLDQNLDIHTYTMKKKFSTTSSGSQYALQAICAHSGGHVTSSGHYVSYCKASDGQWYYYNDDIVTPIPDMQQELNSSFILQNAYLLFYSKV